MIHNSRRHIVILGGGFAGAACAAALASRFGQYNCDVTVVDARKEHCVFPTLVPLLSASLRVRDDELRGVAVIPFVNLFHKTPVRFRRAHVRYWDITAKRVHCDDGELPYDILVVALGSTGSHGDIPGAEEHAWTIESIDDVIRFRRALAERFNGHGGATVVVGGAHEASIASARAIARCFRRSRVGETAAVVYIEHEPALPETFTALEDRGVEVRRASRIARIHPHKVFLYPDEEILTPFTLWMHERRAQELPGVKKEQRGVAGRVVVDRDSRIVGAPDAFAVGDIACAVDASGFPLPQTAVHAVAQGRRVAGFIASSLARKIF